MKKDDAFLVGQNLLLGVRRAMRKTNIIKIIAEHIVDNDILEEDILDQLQETQELMSTQIELEKARIITRKKLKSSRKLGD